MNPFLTTQSDEPPLLGQQAVLISSRPRVGELPNPLNSDIDRHAAKVLIVDDEPLVTRVVRRFLQGEGIENFIVLNDSCKAYTTIVEERPDVILLDINMPQVTGLEILAQCRSNPEFKLTPIIILSSNHDSETKQTALELGANEFLTKPVEKFELTLRVRNALILKQIYDRLSRQAEDLKREVALRTAELEGSRRQILTCLARASEYRDNETGRHVLRVGKSARVIAQYLQMPDEFCTKIEMAAQLHDLGKIGIPDAILLTERRYTQVEFDVMKRHCEIGRKILDPFESIENLPGAVLREVSSQGIGYCKHSLMNMAAVIAQTHHEKWDGTGYPEGLKGEQIPIEGRITAVADVYDALCSKRPYKEKYSIEESIRTIARQRGSHFDPRVVDAFFDGIVEIEQIRATFQDEN